MPIGMITLLIVSVLIFFGFAQRMLDRMRLTDKQALLFIGLIFVGGFFDITLWNNPTIRVNIGGAIIPLILCGYLLTKADTINEKVRAIVAALLTAAVLFFTLRFFTGEPGQTYLDSKFTSAIIAGLVAYFAAGRSRRSAFIAGTLGVILFNIANLFIVSGIWGITGTTSIGGAGAFDTIVMTGVFAVLLAEVLGETREKLQGGSLTERNEKRTLRDFKKIEFTSMLGNDGKETASNEANREKRGEDHETK